MKKLFVFFLVLFATASCWADEDASNKRILSSNERHKPAPKVETGPLFPVTDEAALVKAIEENKFVIVKFYATWCPACKAFNPTVVRVAENFKEKIKFFKVETSNLKRWEGDYYINVIPTLIFFRDGKEVLRSTGVISERALEAVVNVLLE